MPGFRPGIHEFASQELVDAKAKPWHDDECVAEIESI